MGLKKTNFIFILADDLGYADLGCYGGRHAVSPNIDRMAAQGLRFTNGYSNSPVCSPTRFALMTGRYQYRLRGAAEEPLVRKSSGTEALGLPPTHPTIASLLRENGYRTALVGKWHLGAPPDFGPLSSGYDEHFGPLTGGVDYFSHRTMNGERDLWENGSPSDAQGYLTDLLSERASDFVRRCAASGEPFLLSLHYTAPHWPWETREDIEVSRLLGNRMDHLDGGSVETYQRMIHHMDEGIGKLMHTLESLGLMEDTLVVFTSDNGGERFSDNWPLVGGKMDLKEGGIRVPYVIHWPGVVPPGSHSPQLAITMDWVATFLEIAQVQPHPDHPLDGQSLLPVLRDPAVHFDRQLFFRMKHKGQRAMRDGAWKYLRIDEFEYLFNLANDQRERANRANAEPQRLAHMRAEYEQWELDMPAIPQSALVTLLYSNKDMP